MIPMMVYLDAIRLVNGVEVPDTLVTLNLPDAKSLRNFTRLMGMHLVNGPDSLTSVEATIQFLDALKVSNKHAITALRKMYKITNTEMCIVSVITVTTDGTRQMILRTTGTPESGLLTILVRLPVKKLKRRHLTICGISPPEEERKQRS